MARTINLLQLFCLVFVIAITGCNKTPGYTPVSTARAVIDEFWLEKTTANATLNRPYQGMIIGDTAIHLVVDYGTNITALEPTIFTQADSITPTGKQNFTNPVTYTVWAKGKAAVYTVRMVVSAVQFPTVKAMATGSSHIMIVKTDGTVWACGNNFLGQLGLGDYSSRNRLTQVPVYDADQVFSGDAASFIRLKDGTTWGTGNLYGQLGLGNKNSLASFTRVPHLDDALQFAITYGEVFVLKPDGTVWGAGRNLTKLLAQGDYDLRASFVKVPVTNVKQVSGNGLDIVVQKNNGELWGWGSNLAGELGVGDSLPRTVPVLLPSPASNIVKVFAGGNNTFLIDNTGKLWAAGANVRGQLGAGDVNRHSSFTRLSFFDTKSIAAVVPHLQTTSFQETNGAVWNVGDNVYGVMGLGSATTLPFTTPVQLPGFAARSLGGISNTVFAVKQDGTLWAWGANTSGALGGGIDSTIVSSPIQLQ